MDIQAFAGIAGLIVGAAYVIGGLIVNLHLSQYGVTEYGILRVKYLVVGLVFLMNSMAVFVVSVILAALTMILKQTVLQTPIANLIVSLLVSAFLFIVWAMNLDPGRPRKRNILTSWNLYVGISAASLLFPISIAFRQIVVNGSDWTSRILVILAVFATILSFIGQTYFYSRYVYGRTSFAFGMLDPIGMGIPIKIRLAGAESDIALLSHMGIPTLQADLTKDVILLDETDEHYIVGIRENEKLRVLKVVKGLIKGIVYLV